MKKYYFLLALACILPFLTSCKKDDDDKKLDAPEMKTLALQDKALSISFKSAEAPYEEVVLTETGKAIITVRPQAEAPATRGLLLPDYIYGTYTVKGDVYTIYDDEGNFVCHLQMITGEDNLITSTKLFFSSSVSDAVTYVVEVVGKVSDSNLTQDLCRDWTIRYTHITLDGDVKASKVFEAPDASSFNAIIDYAKSKANFNEAIPSDMAITDIMFTQTGTFVILFKNGKIFVGTWKWKNEKEGELDYVWDGNQHIYSYESGKATFDLQTYKKVTYYTLTLSATIKDAGKTYNLSIAFNLEEK